MPSSPPRPLPDHVIEELDRAVGRGAIDDYDYRPPKVYVKLSESIFPLRPELAAKFARKMAEAREAEFWGGR